MGADSYSKCPLCIKAESKDYKQKRAELEKEYGVISSKNWEDKKRKIDSRIGMTESLREDYEFILNIDDCTLEILYICKCSVCDKGAAFEKTVKLIFN